MSEKQDVGEVLNDQSKDEEVRDKSNEEAMEAPREEDKELDLTSSEGVSEEYVYPEEKFSELLRLYEETLKGINEGEIITGRVLKIDENSVLVDIGFKSEGVIPASEFRDLSEIKVGDTVDVFLESMEDQEGQIVLSKQKADFLKVWDRIKEAYDTGKVVEGRVIRRIKGGMVVNLFGVDAFLPGSQIDIRQVKNFDQFVGQIFPLKIIKLNRNRRNIVVSRRAVLEEEREARRRELLSQLEVGQIREGVVKNITDFGAFIDLGEVDGLLHITDMSWGRVSHPSEVVAIGDRIKVKILNFDKERERISLGLKQLTPYPWENIEEKYPVGSRVKGKVVSITDYGAFVELEEGVEGLVHVSEMSWTQHIRHPSKILAVGDVIEAVVLRVNKEEEKISLGIKQLEPDPWETIDKRYPPGTRITGRVRNLTNFGAFVEVEEGIDGLVHISDMSWTRRVNHPSEVMKKGSKVEVVVLSIDKERRRISLGYKQAQENPWDRFEREYNVGAECRGVIAKILDKGVIVELGEDKVEGFVPLSQLGQPNLKDPGEAFNVGDEIPMNVIEFDKGKRKITLSVKAYFEDKEKEKLEEYLKAHTPKPLTIGEVAENLAQIQQSTSEPEAEAEAPEKPVSEEPDVGEAEQE